MATDSGRIGKPTGLSSQATEPCFASPPDGLQSLALRCEEATGPERDLDVAIAVAIDWLWDDWEEGESTARGQAEKHGIAWLAERAREGTGSMWRHLPRYTASLDHAMTLVPEGERRVEFGTYGAGGAWAYLCADNGLGHDSEAATEVLAVCAAALKARALAVTETGTAETAKQGSVPKG